jgi:RHS repeat-associated protein
VTVSGAGSGDGSSDWHLTCGIDGDAQVLDVRMTVNGYEAKTGADPSTSGWTLRKPTTVATWMGGGSTPDLVDTSYYNAAGSTVESRQPAANSAGTDAYITVTAYYTATRTGGCVNASWTGLACTAGPAGQPSSGNPLPVSTFTYNNLNEVLTEAEAVTVSGTTTTRTTTSAYDTAGRKTSEDVAVSPAANGGTAIPTATYGYDTATGLPTTTTASSITLTTGYDSWGQVTSQSDADGNTASTGYDADGKVTSVNDGKGSYSYTYDTSTEHRGLVTSLGVGAGAAPSTFTAGYDGDGRLTAQTYPNGLVASTSYDNTGDATSLTYAKAGAPWLTFSQASSVHGQVRRDATPPATKTLGYDPAGRLTSVVDAIAYGGPRVCTTRTYSYDAESNRTALRSYPDAGGQPDTGNCSTSTTPAVYASGYDQADRLTNTGYVYDLFGRTTTDPYPPSGSSVTVGYYMNDLVASETVGSTTRSYALDPARRIRSWTDGSTTSTNHYTSASGDSPAWIGVGTAWTRNITGIGGDLAATQTDTGTVTLQLTNLHGDVVATVDDTTSASSIASYAESNEFGVPYFTSSAYPRYGWLGGKQRSHDTLASITLMGVRLYDPNTGRFLQTDPVPGGSANPYDYAMGDPVNKFDLDGKCAQLWQKRCRGRKSIWVRGGRASRWVYRHTEVSVSACALRCVGLGTQGGTVYRQTGWGCCYLGANVGIARRTYQNRACNTFGGSGRVAAASLYGAMGIYGNGRTPNAPSADFAGGWAPGVGGGVAGMTNRDILGRRYC